MSPFDYVNSILQNKINLMVDEASENAYNPFLTNRSISYFPDTILCAQEMNINSDLDKKLQYDYLINNIRPFKRRFQKWAKKKEDDNIDVIKEYYNFSNQKAKIALSILSKDQIDEIKKKLEKGGTK